MSDLNNVVITGRLVRDPIVRKASTGVSMGIFTIASNYSYKDKAGGFQEEVAFLPCVIFGRWTDTLSRYHKGEMVLVSGRLRSETWEQDGERRARLGMMCDSLKFFAPPASSTPVPIEPAGTTPPGTNAKEAEQPVPF
jgi:single-strand DNA-binding protein